MLLYNLTINTDQFTDEEAAHLNGDAVLRRISSAGAELEQAA